jgi:hypothetical protein
MSKVAITGNASGTGTLTIAAPNTNTDRTLTLPDAAGEMYTQGNIVGTVSESSGVPTGAIIERGSNANGSFVKYADGTMICTLPPSDVSFSPVTGYNFNWTFPAVFAALPYAFPGGAARVSGAIISGVSVASFAHSTSIVTLTWRSSINIDNVRELSAIAVGRWF